MILDSSAILAVLFGEAEGPACVRILLGGAPLRISAANYAETGIVLDGSRDPVASRRLDELLEEAGVVIEPVTAAQARVARAAYRDFGKGSGHPARLNLGDCFAYALAKTAREPLLCKGNDFIHTGLECVPLDQ